MEVRDTREVGLLLRVTRAGVKTWALRVLTQDGRHTRIRLGAYPKLSLAEARRAGHGEGRVVARYVGGNPNGSLRDIAGITNEAGNVVGLMPHPEHAVEAGYGPTTDGLRFFTSALQGVLSA